MYNVKSNFQVKDIDKAKGLVTAYVSIFGNIDSDGDMIMPGAFKKSIAERGPTSPKPRIKHLWMHDTWNIIGVPESMTEDEKGLLVVSRFGSDANSQERLKMHIDGLITEFSIGYQTIKEEPVEENVNGSILKYNRLIEVKLWEYSSVTWGANSLTSIVKAKGNGADVLATINDRMDRLVKALKTGTYTDETCEQFEIELKQIQSIYIELIKGAEPLKSTPREPDSSTLSDQQVKDMFNILIGQK